MTFTLCVLAGLQLTGRALVSFADQLTPRVNSLLQPYRVELTGVSGGWRGFNPILRAEQIQFAAGEAADVEVELDFFGSLFNDQLIFARLSANKSTLGLVHSPTGWTLKGGLDRSLDIDFLRLSQEIRQVQASLSVSLERDDLLARYDVDLQLANIQSETHLSLTVVSPSADLDPKRFNLTWRRDLDSQSTGPNTQIAAQGDLWVEPGLLAPAGFELSVADSVWVEGASSSDGADVTGQGALGAKLRVFATPWFQPGKDLTLDASAQIQRVDQQLAGEIRSTLHSSGSDSLGLPTLHIAMTADKLLPATPYRKGLAKIFAPEEELIVQAVTDAFVLAPLTEMGRNLLAPSTPAGLWLDGLNVRGNVDAAALFYTPEQGFGFAAQTQSVALDAFRGSPSMNNMQADVYGSGLQIAMQVSGQQVTMGFPDVFAETWLFDQVRGQLQLLFRQGYASVRGFDIEAYSGESRIDGGFATSRPDVREDQRITLGLQVDKIQSENTRKYIPKRLSPSLRQWLLQAPETGLLSDAKVAHHGQIHLQADDRTRRRFELMADFDDADVIYAQSWPLLTNAAGSVHVAGLTTTGRVDRGEIIDVSVAGAEVLVDSVRSLATIDLSGQAQAAALLDLIRQSPLQDSMAFVTPQWRAQGQLDYDARIEVPLIENPRTDNGLQVELVARFEDLSLAMPEYRLAWENLSGQQSFALPHYLQGQMRGRLFDEPVEIDVSHDPENMRFQVNGHFKAEDVFYLAGQEPSPVLTGRDYLEGQLNLAMVSGDDPQLHIKTDLRGFAIDLPAQFRKVQGVLEPSELTVTFAPDHQKLDWRYGQIQGWYVSADNASKRVSQGSIGIDAQPLTLEPSYPGLVVSGSLARVDLADWVSTTGEPAISPPLQWQIRELQVDEFVVNDLSFFDLLVNAQSTSQSLVFQLQGQDIAGSIDLSEADRPQIELLRLRFPALPEPSSEITGNLDPIDLDVGRALPRAKVFVNELYLGDEPFGRWNFEIVPEADAVRFAIDDVSVNGAHITDSVFRWDLKQNISAFSGTVNLDDLAQTLPLWGYAPVLTTTTASVSGNLSWSGSPANIHLVNGEGNLSLQASDGRFLDIEPGGAGRRAVSLLNITALTKRISLDFSDVIGEGISFEKAAAEVQLEDKKLTFTKNLAIESTSSRYELGGEVDLRTDELDAQMIVTLPVSDSLPWYAAYLAFVNPVAGIGLAVGERVLRKPIQRMSSAKFAVSGDLAHPQVVFTELFNRDIAVADPAGDRLSPDLLGEPNAQQTEGGDLEPQPVLPQQDPGP